MPEIVARKCPNCAAGLPASGGQLHIKCQYCGHEFDLKPTVEQRVAAPAPSPVVQVGHVAHMAAVPRSVRAFGCFGVLFPVILMIGISGVMWFSFGSTGLSIPGLGGGITGPRLIWNETIGFFQVNGDAVEDTLFEVRHSGADDQIYLLALDGTTFQQLWEVGPFGNYSQGHQYTHTAIVGNRVLVTDFRAAAHLYDLASGTPVATVPLPDRATEVCVSAAGGTQVWVKVDNGSHALLDTATGATQPSPQSPWGETCGPSKDLSLPTAEPVASDLQIPGFAPDGVLTEGDLRVAVGERAAGIRVPMAVGLGPDGRSPTWTAVLPTVDEALFVEDSSHPTVFRLGGGRLFCAYSLQNDGGRISALDARTGARLWETPLPACCAHGVDVDAMRVGPSRVLTEQFGEAETFDVQTGAMIGRVSPW